jgi:serine/threonine protein kinase
MDSKIIIGFPALISTECIDYTSIFNKEQEIADKHSLNTFFKDEKFYNGSFLSQEGLKTNQSTLPLNFKHLELLYVGVYGSVYSCDNYILKFPSPKEDDLSIIHEFYIGKNCFNILREEGNPHFVYYYGISMGYPPFFDSDSGECCFNYPTNNTNSKMYYLIMEKIHGTTLRQHYESINLKDYLNITLQVLFSISMAEKRFSFTHYDLHDRNIMIRYIGEENILSYRHRNKYISIKTEKIATIIDTGVSFLDGHSFPYNLKRYGVFHQTNSLSDAYKLLCYTLMNFIHNKNALYPLLIPLFRFFIPFEDVGKSINAQSHVSFFYPPCDKNIDDYIDYIMLEYSDVLSDFLEIKHQESKIFYFDGELSNLEKYSIEKTSPIPPVLKCHLTLNYKMPRWMREVIIFFKFYFELSEDDKYIYREEAKEIFSQCKTIYKKLYFELNNTSMINNLKDKKTTWYIQDFASFESFLVNGII